MATVVACPKCSGKLSLTTWSPGRLMRCPRCTSVFRLGGSVGAVETTGPVPTPTPVPTPAPRPVAPSPAPAVRAPEPVRGASRPLVLLAVIAGMLLFVGGTIALAIYVAGSVPAPTPGEPLRAEQPPVPTPTPPVVPTPVVPPTGPAPVTPMPTNPPPTNPPPVNPPMVPLPPLPPVPELPPDPLQEKVNLAITNGLKYIGNHVPTGPNGSTFLVGLTLLECGVSPAEKQVKEITGLARGLESSQVPAQNYDISLAILFLDRLGDEVDKPLIRRLALQMLAAQLPGGGWPYDSPRLSPAAEKPFLEALRSVRPEKVDELIFRTPDGKLLELYGAVPTEDGLSPRAIKALDDAANKLGRLQVPTNASYAYSRVPSLRLHQTETLPGAPPTPGRATIPRLAAPGVGDSSNAQFAALALLAASRHDIPCERALALLAAKFRGTQRASGGWGYLPDEEETPAMTCAGLLALAAAHGIRLDEGDRKREDPAIQAGLKYLDLQLGGKGEALARNLYFIWSLERVGVLFSLKKIGDLDWYEWGAKRLLESQAPNGSWYLGNYSGSNEFHDTCFALLFLKKANLVRDLTWKLDRILDIKGMRRENKP